MDRLCDPALYTGSHKHRFDEEGNGRGLDGRDSVPKNGLGKYRGGKVESISQILRPNGPRPEPRKSSGDDANKDDVKPEWLDRMTNPKL